MKRLHTALALALVCLSAAGWIFYRHPAPQAADTRIATSAGEVRITYCDDDAVTAADRLEHDYAQRGYRREPVSTPTFRLLTQGDRLVTFVAESVKGCTRITAFSR